MDAVQSQQRAPGSPRRAAVLGSPIGHSLSPVLHRAAYAALGLDWHYDAVEMTAAGLADWVMGCDSTWAGLSLTMPLKEAILPLLDQASSLVTATGAANTVVFEQVSGRRQLVGYNTDVAGIRWALTQQGGNDSPDFLADATVAVLGAGATTRSTLVALKQLGAREVSVSARRTEAIEALVRSDAALGLSLLPEPWERAAELLVSDVVVSTVPAGACDGLAVAVPKDAGVLLDVVYAPWPTRLAAAWGAQGGLAIGGLEMLVGQAAEQVRLMTGLEPPTDVMLAAGRAALADR